MFGVAAQYPVTDRLQVSLYAINGYNYLSHPNDQMSYGTHVSIEQGMDRYGKPLLWAGPIQCLTPVLAIFF